MVRERWQQHLAGTGSWAYHLWDVLMSQAWQAEYASRPAVPLEEARLHPA